MEDTKGKIALDTILRKDDNKTTDCPLESPIKSSLDLASEWSKIAHRVFSVFQIENAALCLSRGGIVEPPKKEASGQRSPRSRRAEALDERRRLALCVDVRLISRCWARIASEKHRERAWKKRGVTRLSLVARASLQPLTGRQFGFCFRGLPEQRGATEERKSTRRYAVERQGNCAANKTQWSCGGAATRCVFQLFLIIFWKPRPRLMHTPTPGSAHSRPASLRPYFSPSPYRSLSLFHVQFKNTSTAPPTHRVFFPFSFVLFSRSLGRRCHRLPDKEENSKKRSFESQLCVTGARSKVEITAGIWLNRRHKTSKQAAARSFREIVVFNVTSPRLLSADRLGSFPQQTSGLGIFMRIPLFVHAIKELQVFQILRLEILSFPVHCVTPRNVFSVFSIFPTRCQP